MQASASRAALGQVRGQPAHARGRAEQRITGVEQRRGFLQLPRALAAEVVHGAARILLAQAAEQRRDHDEIADRVIENYREVRRPPQGLVGKALHASHWPP
jgi:hypothetical protein